MSELQKLMQGAFYQHAQAAMAAQRQQGLLDQCALLQQQLQQQRGLQGQFVEEFYKSLNRPPIQDYPPIETASPFDKDGGPLPMTGGARQASRDAGEAKRRMERARQDEALGRALKWTGCWGG